MPPSPPDARLPLQEEAKLLTTAALYLLPLTIGLRADPLGPNYILMIGLMAISVSKVLHLRQAVIKGGHYPRELMTIDIAIVGVLLIMFQLVARPLSLAPAYLWTLSGFLAPQGFNEQQALLLGWQVFWFFGIGLFLLIMRWTRIAQRKLSITRRTPKRYWSGWIAGLIISVVMLLRSLTHDAENVFAWYRWVSFAGLAPVAFLVLELLDDELFDRSDVEVARGGVTGPPPPSATPAPADPPSSVDHKEEYKATVSMIQDTGRNVWVIHGSYLIVAGLMARPLLDSPSALPSSELAAIGTLGVILTILWLASFERTYAFYNFRIRYARMLEHGLGFRLFTDGDSLSRTGAVTVQGLDPVTMSTIGQLASIQKLTRMVIMAFMIGFGLAAVVGYCRLTTA